MILRMCTNTPKLWKTSEYFSPIPILRVAQKLEFTIGTILVPLCTNCVIASLTNTLLAPALARAVLTSTNSTVAGSTYSTVAGSDYWIVFLYLAHKHRPAWQKDIDESKINLGSGKREIVKGGQLDSRYLITVPKSPEVPDVWLASNTVPSASSASSWSNAADYGRFANGT